jgi:hypothetical protein
MPAAPRSCLHTYGGQDDGRDLYRGLQHHPAGLERDYKQEFIAGHGHAQIGQLCADLRRTCHGAAAAHSGGDVRPAPGEDQSHGVAAARRQTRRMLVVSALTSYGPKGLVIFDHPYNEYALPVDDAFAVGRAGPGSMAGTACSFVGPCGLCRAQNHLAVACGRLAGQSMLPSGVPGQAGWRWPRR